LTVNPATQLVFPFQLRIPAWAAGTTIKINGNPAPTPVPGSFARIERRWKFGDRVEIGFPLRPRVSRWFRDSIAIERGPLVFSFGIGEDWVKLRDQGMTADWQVYPTTPWNYALDINATSPWKSIRVAEAEVTAGPFTALHTPVQLQVKARKLPDWRAQDGVADPVPQSPVVSDLPEEVIRLIPYAAAKLRITAFPQLKVDPAESRE
jgi:hypothetical protein